MKANEYFDWLGSKLEEMLLLTDQTDRLMFGRKIVSDSFDSINGMSSSEKSIVLDKLNDPLDRTIGNFDIPYDETHDEDWVEGIVGTITGYYD